MFWNFLIKQSHPWNIWTRMFLALCLVPAIYVQNIRLIVILLIVNIGIMFIFPKPTKKMEIEFSYHAIRGYFLEITGKREHYSKLWRTLAGGLVMKIVWYFIMLSVAICSVVLLWNGYLFWGSVVFYAIISLKMSMVSDWANISRSYPACKEWDELIIIDDISN